MFGVKIYPFYKKNSNCICLNWFSTTFNWSFKYNLGYNRVKGEKV
jgi:hypothetical protein